MIARTKCKIITGLMQLESRLLSTVRNAIDRLDPAKSKPKLLLKIAPDLTDAELKDVAKVITDKKCKVDGLIISNTTISRSDSLQSSNKSETGGLSGAPVKDLSTTKINQILTGGTVPIIGCGGVFNGSDAYEKIRAGASLIQLYTGIVYEGFPVIGKIKRELVECLRKDGFENISDAVGADHKSKK